MTRHSVVLLLALAVTGCPSPEENSTTLWLGPGRIETEVRLIEVEPPPF